MDQASHRRTRDGKQEWERRLESNERAVREVSAEDEVCKARETSTEKRLNLSNGSGESSEAEMVDLKSLRAEVAKLQRKSLNMSKDKKEKPNFKGHWRKIDEVGEGALAEKVLHLISLLEREKDKFQEDGNRREMINALPPK